MYFMNNTLLKLYFCFNFKLDIISTSNYKRNLSYVIDFENYSNITKKKT